MSLYVEGPVVGAMVFLLVGVCHPLVVKVEYHLGQRVWWLFILLSFCCFVASLTLPELPSLSLGACGAAAYWCALELRMQHQRVGLGRAKRNPKRPMAYYGQAAKQAI